MTNESEIDQFIKDQKQKLSQELDDRTTQNVTRHKGSPDRKQWNKSNGQPNIAEEDRKQWNKAKGHLNLAEERPHTPAQAASLQFSNVSEEKKRRLQQERQREYNEFLSKAGQKPKHRNNIEVQPDTAVTNKTMVQQYPTSPRHTQPMNEDSLLSSPTLNEIDVTEHERRNKKYIELLQQKYNNKINNKKNSTRPESRGGFMSKFGEYERDRKKLDEIRKNEYNSLLASKTQRPRQQDVIYTDRSETEGTPSREAPILQAESRQRELFQDFLNAKYSTGSTPMQQSSPRLVDKQSSGVIPGLGDNGDYQLQKRAQRNREYNEMLKRKGTHHPGKNGLSNGVTADHGDVRKVSVTPSYDEILDQKRREEHRYRRHEDPEYSQRNVNAMSYGRENAEAEQKLGDLDREYESRKSRFESERAMNGNSWQLDQPITVDYYKAMSRIKQSVSEDYDVMLPKHNMEPKPTRGTHIEPGPRKLAPPQQQATLLNKNTPPTKAHPQHYRASLPIGNLTSVNNIGGDDRQSARRRKQDQYRQELEYQISQNNSNKRGSEPKNNPGPGRSERLGETTLKATSLSQVSPRSEPTPRRHPVTDAYTAGSDGVLDRGWEGVYEPSHLSRRPPPDLTYQPLSYLNSADAFNSIDEAYRYYGTKNPLDAGDFGLPALPTSVPRSAPLSESQDKAPHPPSSRSVERRIVATSPERQRAYDFRSDDRNDRNKGRANAQEYQRELQKQIMEKQLQNKKTKEEQNRYEMKLEEDIRKYNPFGRGGGGAPIRDEDGNNIVDLRGTNAKPGHLSDRQSALMTQRDTQHDTERDTRPAIDDPSIRPPSQTTADGDPTHARGGHGIFGVPKTENEKKNSDKYKDDLRIQIEEKRRLAEIEKEKIRKEEEMENERLRRDQEKMKQEYENEQKKLKDKEDEVRRRNEEMRKMAEDKKKEEAEIKKKEDEKRQAELRKQQEKERQERIEETRVASPPIPAVKTKLATEAEPVRAASPPVPTLKHKENKVDTRPSTRQKTQTSLSDQQSRAGSANILTQLAAMKKQLQTEKNRVESALVQQQDDYEVYDPRLSQKPAQKRETDIDIFEGARNKAPVTVKRVADPTKDFNDFKHADDTVSRRSFRAKYPEDPHSHDALEIQQDAMIERQEKRLKNLKQSIYEKALPRMNPKDLGMVRQRSLSPQSMLQSETAFIDMNGMNSFPDDFEDLPRNESHRHPKHRPPAKPSTPARYASDNTSLASTAAMGSTISLNVDKMSKKNEERLRRLKDMSTGDDTSIADPDDVLDRFMAKQNHKRPPSGQTLLDDTWMQAGMSSTQQ